MNKDRFKFRAWNGFMKEPAMIYDVQELNGYSSSSYHPIEQFITNMVEEDIIMNSRDFQNLIDTPAYTIMQCLGVRDRKGKFIYEGDLLKRYKKSGECYMKIKQVYFYSKLFDLENHEIVGNIYENPELLTN